MAVIPEASVTFAFSKRQEAWTTRYSFVPTCYANCGDIMLSSKDEKGIWKHDVSTNRNNFYGDQYNSSLNVIFNDYPSEAKMFKSLSIETNEKLWFGRFKTNQEHSDKNNQDSSSQILPTVDREGVKHADIPKSLKNSTSSIQPLPSVDVSEEAFNLAIELIADQPYQPFSVSLFANRIDVDSISSITASGGLEFTEVLRRENDNLINFEQFIQSNYNQLSSVGFVGASGKSVRCLSIDDDLITFRSSRPPGSLSSFDLFVEALKSFLDSENLFLKSSVKVNGDRMRGPYINVSLSSPSNSYLELYAVNIDYELSSSAVRLTQNS